MKLETIAQAAAHFAIPKSAIYRLVREKHLRAVKFPGRRSVFIDPADLERLIESSKNGGVEKPLDCWANSGPIDENQSFQAVENRMDENERKRAGNARNGGKYEWMQRFTRKSR
jgi:excisionase family DNA binding protein